MKSERQRRASTRRQRVQRMKRSMDAARHRRNKERELQKKRELEDEG